MSSRHFATIMAAAAALALGGCAAVDPGFGEALRYDMAIQTIDPDPVYPEDGAKPGDSGSVAAQASKRYRTNSVKQVQTLSTSGTGSGSGPN